MSYLAHRMSDYENVRDFTIQAGQNVTDVPTALTKDEVRFLLRMCLSELQELALSVTDSVDESVQLLHECMNTIDKSAHKKLESEDEIIAAQADAVVDAWYYSCNAFAKKSVDVSQVFKIVHDANMAKRDPTTKKFIKRDDGKIIKPEGWKEPDIVLEISRQRKELTDQLTFKKYDTILNNNIPDKNVYATIKRCTNAAIMLIVKLNIELPNITINVNEKKWSAIVSLAWKDRLKMFIYTHGNCALFDIIDENLLENGYHINDAVFKVREWLDAYSKRKPSLIEVQQMHSFLSIDDMKGISIDEK